MNILEINGHDYTRWVEDGGYIRKRSEYNTKNYKKNGYKSRIHDSQSPHGRTAAHTATQHQLK